MRGADVLLQWFVCLLLKPGDKRWSEYYRTTINDTEKDGPK